jgi:hypothetical protein
MCFLTTVVESWTHAFQPISHVFLISHARCCPTSPLLLLLLQAVVAVSLGQASGSQEQLAAAQQYFRVVGSSANECDTIPGRQAMASCFFLMKLYEDVLVFLNVSDMRGGKLCCWHACVFLCMWQPIRRTVQFHDE